MSVLRVDAVGGIVPGLARKYVTHAETDSLASNDDDDEALLAKCRTLTVRHRQRSFCTEAAVVCLIGLALSLILHTLAGRVLAENLFGNSCAVELRSPLGFDVYGNLATRCY
ncbi:Ribosome biogenesis GTPase A [Anopheles sinensis]|uniref:Ribosome biogenesis GTPase A n=1 Tax=Anopheles sinensis TaxID=74873 RepID=A0A084VWS7_ANOSI|nr:Ribosome biogenesis GTPase A [Anopheles sinensis]